jgi:hypothetical protein
MNNEVLKLIYYKKSVDMIDPDDLSILPDDYAETGLAHILA